MNNSIRLPALTTSQIADGKEEKTIYNKYPHQLRPFAYTSPEDTLGMDLRDRFASEMRALNFALQVLKKARGCRVTYHGIIHAPCKTAKFNDWLCNQLHACPQCAKRQGRLRASRYWRATREFRSPVFLTVSGAPIPVTDLLPLMRMPAAKLLNSHRAVPLFETIKRIRQSLDYFLKALRNMRKRHFRLCPGVAGIEFDIAADRRSVRWRTHVLLDCHAEIDLRRLSSDLRSWTSSTESPRFERLSKDKLWDRTGYAVKGQAGLLEPKLEKHRMIREEAGLPDINPTDDVLLRRLLKTAFIAAARNRRLVNAFGKLRSQGRLPKRPCTCSRCGERFAFFSNEWSRPSYGSDEEVQQDIGKLRKDGYTVNTGSGICQPILGDAHEQHRYGNNR